VFALAFGCLAAWPAAARAQSAIAGVSLCGNLASGGNTSTAARCSSSGTDRRSMTRGGPFSPGRDPRDTFSVPGTNVLIVKFNDWFGL
jgi:hypothetical protein